MAGTGRTRTAGALRSLAILLAFPLEPGVPQRPPEPTAEIAAGRAALEGNDPVRAFQIFASVLARRPDDPQGMQGAARALLAMDRFEDALGHLDRLAARSPGNPSLLGSRGYARFRAGRMREAEGDLRRAIELDPSLPQPPMILSEILRKTERAGEAAELLGKAAARFPGDAGILAGLGETHALLGHDREAEEALRGTLRLDPSNEEARFRLGMVLQRSGRTPEAIAEWERLVEVRPEHRGAWYQLGRAYSVAGRESEGKRALDRFRSLSELEERVEALSGRLKAYPGDAESRLEIAGGLLQLGKPVPALGHLSAVPQDPSIAPRALLLAGRARLRLGHVEIAVGALEAARGLAPKRIDVRLELARAYAGGGNTEKARTEVEAALAIDPKSEEALRLSREVGPAPESKPR